MSPNKINISSALYEGYSSSSGVINTLYYYNSITQVTQIHGFHGLERVLERENSIEDRRNSLM